MPRLCRGGWVGGLAELMLIAMGLSHQGPGSNFRGMPHPPAQQRGSLSLARSLALVAHLSPPSTHMFRLETRRSLMRVLCDCCGPHPPVHHDWPAPHFPTREMPSGYRVEEGLVPFCWLPIFNLICLSHTRRKEQMNICDLDNTVLRIGRWDGAGRLHIVV